MRSRILAAYGPVDKHFQEGAAELQIPIRLRSGQALGCARDDKGEGDTSKGGGCWTGGGFLHLC
jgi:hypothetical protein